MVADGSMVDCEALGKIVTPACKKSQFSTIIYYSHQDSMHTQDIHTEEEILYMLQLTRY